MIEEHPIVPSEAQSTASSWVREFLETMLPAIAIVLAINLFLAQPRVVHGQSMEPNLHENQRVIVDMISYRLRIPKRSEIIVLDVPERRSGPPLIKRVIGLPGDLIEIREGQVLINDQALDEPYLDQLTQGWLGPMIVPEESLFVLGDNRAASNDSRYFGVVPYENILGRAWLCYWPVADIGLFN